MTGCYSVIFIIYSLTGFTSCDEVHGNALNNSPSVESDKRSRLIALNNENGEIKVELDFAVPFLKIPMETKRSGSHSHTLDPLLEVNTKGLVTVATMIFLFITIIPKIVKLFIPQAHATTTDGLIPLMSRIDEAFQGMDISSTECYQRSACWIGSSTFINPSNFTNLGGPDWLKTTINRPEVMEAFRTGQNRGDCRIYKCSLLMQTISKVIALGRSMLGMDHQ